MPSTMPTHAGYLIPLSLLMTILILQMVIDFKEDIADLGY